MRKLILVIVAFATVITACNTEIKKIESKEEPILIKVNLLQDSTTARINEYTLATSDPNKDSIESRKIIDLKIGLIDAIEKRDSAFLIENLHESFSFISGESFYNKHDFINQRLYESLDVSTFRLIKPALHIIDNTAVLSFVQFNKDGATEFKSFWTDVFSKTNGEWKLTAIHKF